MGNIYGSSINNTYKLKFLLERLECYKGPQMKDYDITMVIAELKSGNAQYRNKGRSRSFEITPMSRESVSFYWLSIVGLKCVYQCCTINAIFNIEYWHDLEIYVRGHSRSLETAPYD